MKIKCRRCSKMENTEGFEEQTKAELEESRLCFDCNFWDEKVIWAKLGGKLNTNNGVATVVRVKGTHYLAYPMADPKQHGFLGHGGGLFAFKMLDGTILQSNNVWCQGKIPERYKGLLPDNAERVLTYDEMVEHGFVKYVSAI